jgi:hypothetical protein
MLNLIILAVTVQMSSVAFDLYPGPAQHGESIYVTNQCASRRARHSNENG